jgi:anti-sigma factor RsiW
MSAENERDDVPDLTLERYRLGELPDDQAERLRVRLDGDEELRRRLEMLDQSDREIRTTEALATVAADLRRRAAARVVPDRPRTRLQRWSAPAAVAALLVLVIIVAARRTAPPGASLPQPGSVGDAKEDDRIKGLRPGLAVYRQTARGSEALADGDVVRSGDVVRVGYRAAGRSYGVILSIDGRGAVTLHLPPTEGAAAALRRDATVLLDRAYELDDAPQFEKFFFVTSERPFEAAAVLDAARRAAARGASVAVPALPLPREFEQSTFSLQKEPRP